MPSWYNRLPARRHRRRPDTCVLGFFLIFHSSLCNDRLTRHHYLRLPRHTLSRNRLPCCLYILHLRLPRHHHLWLHGSRLRHWHWILRRLPRHHNLWLSPRHLHANCPLDPRNLSGHLRLHRYIIINYIWIILFWIHNSRFSVEIQRPHLHPFPLIYLLPSKSSQSKNQDYSLIQLY